MEVVLGVEVVVGVVMARVMLETATLCFSTASALSLRSLSDEPSSYGAFIINGDGVCVGPVGRGVCVSVRAAITPSAKSTICPIAEHCVKFLLGLPI